MLENPIYKQISNTIEHIKPKTQNIPENTKPSTTEMRKRNISSSSTVDSEKNNETEEKDPKIEENEDLKTKLLKNTPPKILTPKKVFPKNQIRNNIDITAPVPKKIVSSNAAIPSKEKKTGFFNKLVDYIVPDSPTKEFERPKIGFIENMDQNNNQEDNPVKKLNLDDEDDGKEDKKEN